MNIDKHIDFNTLAENILRHATFIWYLEPNFVKDEETYKRKIDSNFYHLERYVKELNNLIKRFKKDENRYYPDKEEIIL